MFPCIVHDDRFSAHAALACRVALQLRQFVYKCTSALLIAQDRLVHAIESQSWSLTTLRNDPSDYVEAWAQRFEWLHETLIAPNSNSSNSNSNSDTSSSATTAGASGSSPSANGANGSGNSAMISVPAHVRPLIHRECVQAIMDGLLEGFARASQRKCSTEGRALMSMDLQVLRHQ